MSTEQLDATRDEARWPIVLGTIALFVGALGIINRLDDFMVAAWTAEQWESLFGSRLGGMIYEMLPSGPLWMGWTLLEIAIAGLLVAGGWHLRLRHRLGVTLCWVWGWLAIADVVVVQIATTWWLNERTGAVIPADSAVAGAVSMAMVLATLLLLAIPAMMLIWLARPEIKAEYAGWPS